VANLGYTQIVKRSKNVKYFCNIFDTNFKIFAQTNFAVERSATSRFFDKQDIYWGIKNLFRNKKFNMIDVGANVGIYSLAAAHIGAKKIYAIEPGHVYSKLISNISINHLQKVISTYKIGIGSKVESLKYYEDLSNPGNAILVNRISNINKQKTKAIFSKKFINVKVVTLDQLFKKINYQHIDLIKIDVEGMEYDVIKGAMQLIKKNRPIIVAETHKSINSFKKNKNLDSLFSTLYKIGYKSYLWRNNQMKEFFFPDLKNQDTFFINE
jgi:FkbM family methyltransferase